MTNTEKLLILNQNKMIKKIQEIDAAVEDLRALAEKVSGLTTALIGAGVLTEEGLELHQSFKVEKPEEEKGKESV